MTTPAQPTERASDEATHLRGFSGRGYRRDRETVGSSHASDGVEGAARPVGRRDYHWSLTPTGPGQDGDISLPFHYA